MAVTQAAQQQQTTGSVAEELASIGRTLDTLTENSLNLLRCVNDRAEAHGWGDRHVRAGLDQLDAWRGEEERLRARRRWLWGAATRTPTRAS